MLGNVQGGRFGPPPTPAKRGLTVRLQCSGREQPATTRYCTRQYSINGYGHNLVSRTLMDMGHWKHFCIVNTMNHHYVRYLSSTDEWYEDEETFNVYCVMPILSSMLLCPLDVYCSLIWSILPYYFHLPSTWTHILKKLVLYSRKFHKTKLPRSKECRNGSLFEHFLTF